jgi:hypothetical protein
MPKGDVHVVYRKDQKKWAVEVTGNSRASSLHDKKAPAETAGTKTAKSNRSELSIHGKDGKIQEKNTYKKDPFPPRG